ncbi:MAG: hypothetical protein R2932_16830 [Caldilineaceae bacterium]
MSVQTKSPKRTKKATTSGGTRRAGRGAGKQTAGKSGHQKHVADLYEFTVNFFTILGAAVKRTDRRKHGPIVVTLSAELAAYFDTESLLLAFHQAEPVQGQLLVAHGSPIFDRMVTYLERKSAVTVQRLPIRYGAGEELLQAVRPTNAGIVNLRTRQEVQHLFAFHWRITYRADDKREEIYTVLLNDTGERISSYSEATTSSADPVRQFEIDTLLTDSEPIPPETDEEGQLVPPKLPPMTQLTRLAETARKYAVYHADVRCVSHESDILPRLYKTLNRLRTYYQQQIEEVYDAHDPTGEKRQALELDLERKLAEEVENHRLRVQLQLVNYAIFQMPVAEAHLTLSDGVREAAVVVERNRYTGALRRPTCHACGHEAAAVAIDRNGHITCDNCIQQCGTCQDILCADCGVASCPACGKLNCDTCGQLCWACGERACAEHISTCPTCGDAVCHSCQTACGACGVQQCRSHLRVDHVHSQRGETVLVCSNCAIRCPDCEQYSAQIGGCRQVDNAFVKSAWPLVPAADGESGQGFMLTLGMNLIV